jgi:hypothetical protein
MDELRPDENAKSDTAGLPLFDWADTEDRSAVTAPGAWQPRKRD